MKNLTINKYIIRADSCTGMTVRVHDKTFGMLLHQMGHSDNDICMSQITVMEQLNNAEDIMVIQKNKDQNIDETILRISTPTHILFVVIPEVSP